MEICQLSFCDIKGGAAKAAFRLHQACLENGLSSRLCVSSKRSDLITVDGPKSKLQTLKNGIKDPLEGRLMRLQRSPNKVRHSPAFFSSSLVTHLNQSSAEVLHLHWVNQGFLSVEDIGKLTKPLVWTLHDMWAFSGAEHYTDDGPQARWRLGYFTH